jgi:hypothetical protein
VVDLVVALDDGFAAPVTDALPGTLLDGFSANGFGLAGADFSVAFTGTLFLPADGTAAFAALGLAAGRAGFAEGIGGFTGFFIAFAMGSTID